MTMQTLATPVSALCTRAAERAQRQRMEVVAVDWKAPGRLIGALIARDVAGAEHRRRPSLLIPAAVECGDESAVMWGPYSWLDHLPASPAE